MKNYIGGFLGCFLLIYSAQITSAQDEDVRFPTKLSENSTNTNKGNLSGRVTVRGLDPNKPKPTIFIVVFFNGIQLDRRQVFENGNYTVPGIPRENVAVAIEVNGAELSRQQLPLSLIGQIRQDFDITMPPEQSGNGQSGIISAKNFYQRSEENEKIFVKAIAAGKEKKADNAIALYKQLLSNDPNDFVAWTELGTLYFRQEKDADAEKAYLKAIELKPDFIVALINLGRLYMAQNQLDKSLAVLQKAVEIEPASANAQQLLGEAYLQAKKGSKAVVHLYEALRLAPLEKAEIHLRLAALYNGAGLKEKAAEEYKQFLAKVPKHPDKEKFEKYIKENSSKD